LEDFEMKYTDAIPPSYYNPDGLNPYSMTVTDEFLCGETVRLWSAREHSKHLMSVYNAEMLDSDAVLGELFFRQKRKLCRVGRGGGWHQWLQQNRISRSVADRLALEFAEHYDLADELEHRFAADPIEGRICQRARRTADRLRKSLPSPRSRMTFLQVLADLLNLQADWKEGAVRLSIPPPEDEEKWKNVVVPPVMVIGEDGHPVPVDYELKSSEAEDSTL
jgi:hypothetical protein